MLRPVNLDFFAAETDLREIFDFLFSATDVRVFESYSEYDSDLREFKSTDELAGVYQLGRDPAGNGHAILLQLWSPLVMRDLVIRRFSLNPSKCDGHTFRHNIEGGGLMQLYLGGVHDLIITMSHFGHQSQVRAQSWGVGDGVDWEALGKVSRPIEYHIRNRLALAKVPGRPVLREALELARRGYALKPSMGTPWAFELSSEILEKS
jgi:hypothetical protein